MITEEQTLLDQTGVRYKKHPSLNIYWSEDSDEYTNRWRDYARQQIYMWSEVRKWRNRHRDWVSQHWAEVQAHSKEFHGRRVREY